MTYASSASTSQGRARGFTLIELLIVILMLGVISVFVAPSMGQGDQAAARAHYEEVKAATSLASRLAYAQRRAIKVESDGDAVTYRYVQSDLPMELPGTSGDSGELRCPKPACLSVGSVTFYAPPSGEVTTSTGSAMQFVFSGPGGFSASFSVSLAGVIE